MAELAQGRNQKGEEGLFPATYISEELENREPVSDSGTGPSPAAASAPPLAEPASPSTPPSPRGSRPSTELRRSSSAGVAPDQVQPGSGVVATAAAGLGAAAVGVTTVMGKTIGEIEHAIEKIALPDTKADSDEEELGIGSNARARLAAQAQLANEQRDKNRASGGVAGLVYSDESEDEEEERRRSVRNGSGPAKPNNIQSTLQPALALPGTPPLDKPPTIEKSRLSIGSASTPNGQAVTWSVDEVVQWAKSKGFEEWPKFQEHEITGDLLLELDANLLKELDIPQFGKRLRIAQAISELRRPSSISSPQMSPGSASLARGMSAPPNTFAMPINSSPPPSITPPLSGDSTHSRKVSTNSTSMAPPMQPIHETAASNATTTSASVPPSPVTPGSANKRESFGSLGHRKGKLSIESKERLSFFGRNRKPAPSTPSDTKIMPRNTTPQVHQMNVASPQEPAVSSTAAAMKQIGKPDYSGYMKKKGERYGWKTRFFVLKGAHLYYMASETVSWFLTQAANSSHEAGGPCQGTYPATGSPGHRRREYQSGIIRLPFGRSWQDPLILIYRAEHDQGMDESPHESDHRPRLLGGCHLVLQHPDDPAGGSAGPGPQAAITCYSRSDATSHAAREHQHSHSA